MADGPALKFMDVEKEKQKPNLIEIERHRLVYFIKDEAERKYKEFKNNDGEVSVVLYQGDFRPLVNRARNNGELELMLPSEIFITVPYSLVFLSILRVFDLDRSSNDFDGGNGMVATDINTANLNRFRKEHPDSKLRTDYMLFELIAPEDEERTVIGTRFSDPITKEPLTLLFEAIKYKNI